MDLIAKERDRLLQRTARVYGSASPSSRCSASCCRAPSALRRSSSRFPCSCVLGVAQFRVGVSRSPIWLALAAGRRRWPSW